LPVKRRYPVRQEFTDRPKVIGDACRHRRGHGTPSSKGTSAERGFGSRQGDPPTGMGQDQMVVRQRQPQLFFKPGDVLGNPLPGFLGGDVVVIAMLAQPPAGRGGVAITAPGGVTADSAVELTHGAL
jgi:hypothetical protein